MKYFDHRVIKTALGTFIAVSLASLLGLSYGITAGIVAIISIQATKMESLKVALERLIASIVGLFIAVILFYFFGYSPLIFSIFVLIFMPVCLKFNLFQGFLATVVLATHVVAEQNISFKIIFNEVLILVLGALTAIILNLYMPDKSKKVIDVKNNIDLMMKKILNYMGEELITGSIFIDEEKIFKELKKDLDIARDLAFYEYNNSLFYSSRYMIELFNMKRAQYKVLTRMRKHFYRLTVSVEYSGLLADFTKKLGDSIGVENLYKEVLKELETLREKFRNMSLPSTRGEFENRAILYQFLNDVEEFIEIKEDFLKKYTFDGIKK